VGHTVTSGAKFNKKDKATWWAIQLGEQKVHVVAAALSLVGDRQMQLLLNEAEVLHATEQAASLGGAFMKVMKDVEIDGTTLYDHAKQISGERELERVRERQRMRVRSRNGKNLY
jgi:secreted PhoX family phosphatase